MCEFKITYFDENRKKQEKRVAAGTHTEAIKRSGIKVADILDIVRGPVVSCN